MQQVLHRRLAGSPNFRRKFLRAGLRQERSCGFAELSGDLWPPELTHGITFVFEEQVDAFEEDDRGLQAGRKGIHAAFGELVEGRQVCHVGAVVDQQIAQVRGVLQGAVVQPDLIAAPGDLVFPYKLGGALPGGFDLDIGGVEEVRRGFQGTIFRGDALEAESAAQFRPEQVELEKGFTGEFLSEDEDSMRL